MSDKSTTDKSTTDVDNIQQTSSQIIHDINTIHLFHGKPYIYIDGKWYETNYYTYKN